MKTRMISLFLALNVAASPAFAAMKALGPIQPASVSAARPEALAAPAVSAVTAAEALQPAAAALQPAPMAGAEAISRQTADVASLLDAGKEVVQAPASSGEDSARAMAAVFGEAPRGKASYALAVPLSAAAVPAAALVSAKALAIAGGAALIGAAGYYGGRMMANVLRLKQQKAAAPVPLDPAMVDAQQAAQRLGQALRFKTISSQDPNQFPAEEFERLRAHLQKSFPLAFSRLKLEMVNTHSFLFTWEGTEKDLKPVLLLAHQDVVPVEPGTEKDWKEEPFGGKVDGEFVWGRGAIDDKGGMMANLEAVEALLKAGHKPKRTLYLALGHDEEVGGNEGARKISELLQARGVRLEAVFDEGGLVAMNQYPGIDRPVAKVSIAEKGYLTLRLDATGQGVHSALPPPAEQRSILTAAKAITHLHAHEDEDFPLQLSPVVLKTLSYLAPYMPTFWERLIYANVEWFRPFQRYVIRRWKATPAGHAILRTTSVPTMIGGGVKENMIPKSAWAIVQLRLLFGETIASALERVKKRVEGPNLTVTPLGRMVAEPTAASDLSSSAYKALEKTIREILPEAIIVPSLLTGATDSRHFRILTSSRHFAEVTENIYRFRPWRAMTSEDLRRFHGANERVSIKNYSEYLGFYVQLIRNLDMSGSGGN